MMSQADQVQEHRVVVLLQGTGQHMNGLPVAAESNQVGS